MQLVIFDPRLGSEETAERKLLFYHPASTPLDQRVKTVGLAEAVTNLLSSFTAHDPEALHTQHGRQIFLQPEPNLWLVLLAPNQASPAVKPTAADASAKDKDSADLETRGSSWADTHKKHLPKRPEEISIYRSYARRYE